jgi:hypothetical protein
MSLKKIRWYACAAIAFVMGFPMAEEAAAQSAFDVVASSISLAIAIAGVAGDSLNNFAAPRAGWIAKTLRGAPSARIRADHCWSGLSGFAPAGSVGNLGPQRMCAHRYCSGASRTMRSRAAT